MRQGCCCDNQCPKVFKKQCGEVVGYEKPYDPSDKIVNLGRKYGRESENL